MGVGAVSYQALVLWNHLPISTRGADTLSALKSRYSFLIKLSFTRDQFQGEFPMMHQASPPIVTDVSPTEYDTNLHISQSLCAFLFRQVADDDSDEKLITVRETAMSPPIFVTTHICTHVTSASAKKQHNIHLAAQGGPQWLVHCDWSPVEGGSAFLTVPDFSLWKCKSWLDICPTGGCLRNKMTEIKR